MENWVDTGLTVQDIPLNQNKSVIIDNQDILLSNVEGSIFACLNVCPHEYQPLTNGSIDPATCIITCPFHGAKFSLKTGEIKAPPAFEDLMIYETKVIDSKILILL